MRILITTHAYERGQERLGLSAKSFRKLVAYGYCFGLQAIETKGALKAYVETCLKENNNTDAFIYAENIFIITNNRVITVYRLPLEIKKHLPKYIKLNQQCENL